MTHRTLFTGLILSAVLATAGCRDGQPPQGRVSADHSPLVGAWRSRITFRNGSLSEMKGLEFLYSFNAGGTMTESSNYDEAANSTPPAYGIWKQVDPQTFQAKYLFYTTKEPGPAEAPAKGDWWPAGHGVLTETIRLSSDGQTFTSTVTLAMYDRSGAPIAGGGEGTGAGSRIVF